MDSMIKQIVEDYDKLPLEVTSEEMLKIAQNFYSYESIEDMWNDIDNYISLNYPYCIYDYVWSEDGVFILSDWIEVIDEENDYLSEWSIDDLRAIV